MQVILMSDAPVIMGIRGLVPTTLSLTRPGEGTDYAHPIMISQQSFESQGHACIYTTCTKIMLIQASPLHGTPIGYALLKCILGNLF